MNNHFVLAVVTAVGISAVVTTAVAAPLPAGTLLRITPSTDLPATGDLSPCATGSCFGMFLFPGVYFWTPLHPGTDGGIVIGKPQKSGGQELVPGPGPVTDGELSAVWIYAANFGTFFTAPDAASNIFDSASCAGAACLGKTELKTFNAAWYGTILQLGSAIGCDTSLVTNCTSDQANGIFVNNWMISGPIPNPPTAYSLTWGLEYSQVIQQGPFMNYPIQLLLRGTISMSSPLPPPLPPNIAVFPENLRGIYGLPMPFSISATDPDAGKLSCRIGAAPSNGVVTLSGCTAGTYTSNTGYIGTDSFTIIANNGQLDSNAAMVTTVSTSPVTDNRCADLYPLVQKVVTGIRGHLTMTVTGNIISANLDDMIIKICPTTSATYEVRANTRHASVVCKIRSITTIDQVNYFIVKDQAPISTSGQGLLKVNELIKCKTRRGGRNKIDKVILKILSGVNLRPI